MTDTKVRTVLELRGIVAGYDRVTVLKGVDVAVPAGAVVAVMGPNGAGKTTLMRVAAGLLAPREGTVRINETDATGAKAHQRARAGVCAIPEGRGVFPDLSVQENLVLQAPAGTGRSRFELAFAAFPKLKQRLGQRAGSLSGGEQQMLALSRCFMHDPAVVLLDEVSMGLAPLVVDEVYAALDELVAAGVSLLLVEQYVHRALALASSVYVLNKGAVTFHGSPRDIAEDDLVRHYLGGAPGQVG